MATPPGSIRVGTCNVLYEGYYRRACKVDLVPEDRRCAMFGEWVGQALAAHDVLAMQEFPYDGDAAAFQRGGAAVPAKGAKVKKGVPVPAPSAGKGVAGKNALWRQALAAAAKAANFEIVAHESEKDGILFAVNASRFEVLKSHITNFPPSTFSGPGAADKKRGYVLLKDKMTGVAYGIVNAHVPWARDVAQSCANVREVFSVVDAAATPHWVAVGDWNVAAPKHGGKGFYEKCGLPAGWTDATALLPAMTCAADRGEIKIDYITHSPTLQCEGIDVVPEHPGANVQHTRDTGAAPEWFSDHSCVSATLTLLG